MPGGRCSALRPWWPAGLLLLALIISSGCSGGSGEDTASGPSPEVTGASFQVTSTAAAAEPDNGGLPEGVSEEKLAAYMERSNDFVRGIIEDGYVTAAEYEAAVLEVMRCLDEHGIPHTEPELQETVDGPRWRYTTGPYSNEELEEKGHIHDECDMAYLRTVLGFWVDQNAPSEREVQERDAAFVQCL